MTFLKLTCRRVFRKGEHTATRIISLAAGLAFSIFLLLEVLYLYSFDSFYPDADRIYVVCENFRMDRSSEKLEVNDKVSGAIAPGLKSEVPGIEATSRLNSIGSSIFYTEDKKSYKAEFVLADENLFDVLPRPMISGNPRDILKSPMNCMVSDKIANAIGGNVIGKFIELKEYPNRKLTISGVFEALPENTNYKYDILISMVSTSQFTWDGTNNWMGNDRYYTCVKLASGVSSANLAPAVRKMQEKHQDIQKLEQTQQGLVLKYSFEPIREIHAGEAKNMILILSLIAFAVLFVSLLNYILLTLTVLSNRGKTSAIHKCCGAQSRHLLQLVFSETLLTFLISLIGAFVIILLFKPLAEAQVGHQLLSVLNVHVVFPILLLLVVVVFVISYLPGRFYSMIPVASAFRSYRQKGNKWKLALLSLQFVGATFILTLMVIITLQYNKMTRADHGYRAEKVFYGSSSGMDVRKIGTVLNELRALPEVKLVGLGCGVPTDGASGNNVYSPDGKKELFNVADFYWVDDNYLAVLGIQVAEGQSFSSKNSVANNLMISRKGAEMLKMNNGWADGVVGKQIEASEHNAGTIEGVFSDFVVGSVADPDVRPSIFYFLPEEKFIARKLERPSFSFNILIKVHEGVQSGMLSRITTIFNMAMPHPDAIVYSLADVRQQCYSQEKGFRNSMMAGNLIMLLISGIGLLGYTASEVTRRRKELAIRRISGAHFSDILRMFIYDLEYIAIPAVILGLGLAWFTAGRWMQNFASRIVLSWELFAVCSLFMFAMIAFTAVFNYLRIANDNPVEALRYE